MNEAGMARTNASLRALFKTDQAPKTQRLYEFDRTSRRHPFRRMGDHSGNAAINHVRGKIREGARWLVENHDVAVAIRNVLQDRIVGTGTSVEPLVQTMNGELAEDVNDAIRREWAIWLRDPDVTGELAGVELERMAVGSWLVDGEVFAQHIGPRSSYQFPDIPYAVELIEADLCPIEETYQVEGSVHGVIRNAWGRPRAYVFFLQHPGDRTVAFLGWDYRTKTVAAENIIHLKSVHRIQQIRGMSIFHAAIDRILDTHHYEDNERIAARVAAQMTTYIKRDLGVELPDDWEPDDFMLEAGSTFELRPGEDVGLIDSKRPNQNLAAFVSDQLRRVAAGTGTNFSSISKVYDKSYSAQRQELVESEEHYKVLRTKYYTDFLSKVYRRFVATLAATGRVSMANVDPMTAYDVWMRGPAMPSIDPLKDANAAKTEIESGTTSRHDVIRAKGRDPRQVDQEIDADEFTPAAERAATAAAPAPDDADDASDGDRSERDAA